MLKRALENWNERRAIPAIPTLQMLSDHSGMPFKLVPFGDETDVLPGRTYLHSVFGIQGRTRISGRPEIKVDLSRGAVKKIEEYARQKGSAAVICSDGRGAVETASGVARFYGQRRIAEVFCLGGGGQYFESEALEVGELMARLPVRNRAVVVHTAKCAFINDHDNSAADAYDQGRDFIEEKMMVGYGNLTVEAIRSFGVKEPVDLLVAHFHSGGFWYLTQVKMEQKKKFSNPVGPLWDRLFGS